MQPIDHTPAAPARLLRRSREAVTGRRPGRILVAPASVGGGHDGIARELVTQLRSSGHRADLVDALDLLPARLGRLLCRLSRRTPRHERPPGQQLLDAGRATLLAQLLATLPSEQRKVLVLRVPLRLSVDDTAELVGTSPATVRLVQHHALNRLREELHARFHDPRCPT
jgi:DNA-directed RNA polymerase specialized sigma24 family protein